MSKVPLTYKTSGVDIDQAENEDVGGNGYVAAYDGYVGLDIGEKYYDRHYGQDDIELALASFLLGALRMFQDLCHRISSEERASVIKYSETSLHLKITIGRCG